jgi:hypothetical protein
MSGTLNGAPQRSAHLRLVGGELTFDQSPEFETALVRRPGQAVDAFSVEPSLLPIVRGLAAEADRRGLHLDLASALVVEHGLVREQISAFAREDVEVVARSLDLAAGAATQDHVARGPQADYLRALVRARDRDVRALRVPHALSRVLALPVRLLDRGAEAVGRGVASGSLEAALSWEIAAVASGQSMSEWVAWQLVQRADARPS